MPPEFSARGILLRNVLRAFVLIPKSVIIKSGYSAATAISQKILKEGAPARDAYREFLKTGDSDYPVELLKIAGVDMSAKEPVILAMETFKKLVEELEELL